MVNFFLKRFSFIHNQKFISLYELGQNPQHYHGVRACADRRRPHQALPQKVWIPGLVLQKNTPTYVPGVQDQIKGHSKHQEERHGHYALCHGYIRALQRIFNKYNVVTTMRPLSKLRGMLVYPKGKRSLEDSTVVVYQIPCKDCDKVYVWETGRKFGVRKAEHKQEAETLQNAYFTRSEKKEAEMTPDK